MKIRTIPAGEFKAKCLAILDEVAETDEQVVITKRGRPVAKLVPARTRDVRSDDAIRDQLAAMVVWSGDVLSPVVDDDWEEQMEAEWDELGLK